MGYLVPKKLGLNIGMKNFWFKNLIFGTKNKMHMNTTGQAIIKRSNHNTMKLLLKPIFIEMINSDTNVLVKKDIIMANIINRYLFILTEYHKT